MMKKLYLCVFGDFKPSLMGPIHGSVKIQCIIARGLLWSTVLTLWYLQSTKEEETNVL